MKRKTLTFAAALIVSTVALAATDLKYLPSIVNLVLAQQTDSNSFAITNGNVYTVNSAAPRAQAVLVKEGIITKVGSDQQILEGLDRSTRVINLKGKFLMPGFQDAHQHLAEAGFNEIMCVFDETLPSIGAYRAQLEACADDPENADSPWILGAGISVSEMLSDKSQTPRSFLDGLFPETPVLILDNVGHGAWANTRAMQLAGYAISNPIQPQGGILLTDSSGSVTGVVFENAQQKLRDVAFQAVDPDQSLAYAGLLKGLKTMAENGVTSISDAGGYWTRSDQLIWARAERESKMTVRAFNALYVFPDREADQQIPDIKALFSNTPTSLVKFNTVKLYVDGILSLGTSALKDDYNMTVVDALNYPRGYEYFKSADLTRYAREFDKAGFQLHFHVTGDHAANIALNAIANAASSNNSQDRRHRLTHAYLIGSDDRARFKDNGVIADFQLNPSSLDTKDYVPFLKDIIGSQRATSLIPVNSMLEANAKVILSSDYDAGPISALGTIERALTRRDNAAERVPTLEKAIEMVTLDVAYALHNDTNTGSIEVGKQADLIVLDQDITSLATNQIGSAKVQATLLSGKVVFDVLNAFE